MGKIQGSKAKNRIWYSIWEEKIEIPELAVSMYPRVDLVLIFVH